MKPQRAREIGFEPQTDGSYLQVLYTVYIGGESEHRDRWSKYKDGMVYEQAEAEEHAREAKHRLSAQGKKVAVWREITTVERVITV